jgi:putative inorganic carbon (hco3(-)) transporter
MKKRLFDLRRIDWVESALLLIAAPFLIFPGAIPVGALIALLLVVVALVVRWIVERCPWRVAPFNGALLLWSVMIVVGILVTAFPDVTLPKATGLLLGLATYRYLVSMVRGPRQLRLAVWGGAVVGVIITLAGAVSVKWLDKVPLITQRVTISIPRLLELPGGAEPGISANQFGGTLVIFGALLLSAILGALQHSDRNWLLMLWILLGIGVLLLIVLTQSRGAWLGTVFGALVVMMLWGAFSPVKVLRYVLWSMTLLAFIALIGGAWWVGPERLQHLWQEPAGMTALGNLETLGFRQEVWRWALVATQDFPFTGCGLGTFREVVRLLYPLDVSPGYDVAHAHNIFLQVALDLGFPGLIAYLALLAIAGVVGLRVALRCPDQRALAVGLIGGLVSLHIYGLLDALAPGSKTTIVFWIALGLLAALDRLDEEDS